MNSQAITMNSQTITMNSDILALYQLPSCFISTRKLSTTY